MIQNRAAEHPSDRAAPKETVIETPSTILRGDFVRGGNDRTTVTKGTNGTTGKVVSVSILAAWGGRKRDRKMGDRKMGGGGGAKKGRKMVGRKMRYGRKRAERWEKGWRENGKMQQWASERSSLHFLSAMFLSVVDTRVSVTEAMCWQGLGGG